jgi:Glycosyl hydrolases family 18
MNGQVTPERDGKVAARPRRRGRRAVRAVVAIACVLAVAVLADYQAYPRCCAVGGRSFNSGDNGLWLRYTWYFGEHSDADVRRLARDLQQRQIRYAYVHVRDITREGRLHFGYGDTARRLVRALHRDAPAVRLLAWVYAGNRRGQASVDLSDRDVRRAMVGEAVWLTRECGFDGIQWDYEVSPSGDADYVLLMQETRAALSQGKIVSAAVPMWVPWPLRRVTGGWSEGDFARMAAASDQLAVMCYDSGLALPRLYVELVRLQARHVTRAVARGGPACRVLLGLPTYGKGCRAHHAWAENVRLALKGVREGLADPRARPATLSGVALFADYTTEPAEWRSYERLWLGAPADGG